MKGIKIKGKLKVAQQKLRAHGFEDEEYAALRDFVVDERADRQTYSQELKDLLQRMVNEGKGLFARRATAAKEQQRAREEDAARALLAFVP